MNFDEMLQIANAVNNPNYGNEYMSALEDRINQNNAWSAEQAQKQMDFQERMSNTAIQRQIADLKAAGINPILSARLGGASTPQGSMAVGQDNLNAFVDVLEKSLDLGILGSIANSGASVGNGYSNYGTGVGNANTELKTEQIVDDLVDSFTSGHGLKNGIHGFIHGLTGQEQKKYDTTTAYVAGQKLGNAVSGAYKETSNNLNNAVVHKNDGTVSKPSIGSKILTTIQKAITGSNRNIK